MIDAIGYVGSYIPPQLNNAGAAKESAPEPPKPEENAQATQSAAAAVFFSPAIKIDPGANMAIYVVRNSETGEVINQYPNKKVVDEYRQMSAKGEVKRVQAEEKSAAKPEVKAEPKPDSVVATVGKFVKDVFSPPVTEHA